MTGLDQFGNDDDRHEELGPRGGSGQEAPTDDYELRGDEHDAVSFPARLADTGPAPEPAIGNGRIAVPLAATGIRVDGIEIAPTMITRLRARPGGEQLRVVEGDMADVAVPDSDPLVFVLFVVFNSIFNLLTQDEQVRCFANVAAHLTDVGVFGVEAALPGPGEAVPGPTYRLDQQWVATASVDTDRVVLEVGRYDPSTQLIDKNRVQIGPGGTSLDPVSLRFAWPSELDLMARLAGLRLRSRRGGWRAEQFSATSRRHLSVYAH